MKMIFGDNDGHMNPRDKDLNFPVFTLQLKETLGKYKPGNLTKPGIKTRPRFVRNNDGTPQTQLWSWKKLNIKKYFIISNEKCINI